VVYVGIKLKTMSKDPAVLLYTGDFLNGCTCLTMEERGQYITMLCLQHQIGHLSEKTIRLSVGSVSVDVLKKFEIDPAGNYFNARMDVEIQKRAQFIESRSVNGSKGGRPQKASAKASGLAKKKLADNDNKNGIDLEFNKVFEIFRQNYPGTKRGFDSEFENLKKKHKNWKEIVPLLSDALIYQQSAREIKRMAGGFVPEWKNLQTWINQKCWEEEILTNNISNEVANRNNKSGATPEQLRDLIVRTEAVER